MSDFINEQAITLIPVIYDPSSGKCFLSINGAEDNGKIQPEISNNQQQGVGSKIPNLPNEPSQEDGETGVCNIITEDSGPSGKASPKRKRKQALQVIPDVDEKSKKKRVPLYKMDPSSIPDESKKSHRKSTSCKGYREKKKSELKEVKAKNQDLQSQYDELKLANEELKKENKELQARLQKWEFNSGDSGPSGVTTWLDQMSLNFDQLRGFEA